MILDKKSFVFGIGTGIILISLIFYIAYSFDYKKQAVAETKGVEVSDAVIIERAKKLGMISYSELPHQQSPEPEKQENSLSVEEIIEQAENLGMIFREDVATLENAPNEPDSSEEVPVGEVEHVLVTIAPGKRAFEIAALLQDAGVITNAREFTNFMVSKQVTTTILPGTFRLPIGGEYENIVSTIRNKANRVKTP